MHQDIKMILGIMMERLENCCLTHQKITRLNIRLNMGPPMPQAVFRTVPDRAEPVGDGAPLVLLGELP